MALGWYGVIRYHGRGFTSSMFLLRNSNGGANIFDVLEHENRIFLRILQLLEQKKRFLVIAQASFNAVAYTSA